MPVTNIGMSPQIYHYFQVHIHDVWEVTLNLEGSGYSIIDGRRFDYKPGTITCCPPNTPHEKFSDEGFRDIFITASDFSGDKMFFKSGVMCFSDDVEGSFEGLMFLAYRTLHQPYVNYKLLVNTLWDAMQQLLLSWMQKDPEDERVAQLKNAIVDSFTDPEFSVARLLSGSAYCADYIRRRFKQFAGMTPMEYLTFLRIEHAKKLMQQNNVLRYNIAEIGAMSGYYDSHYFARVFKKSTGKTPTQYLQEL